jgi:hypothetical protein
MTGASPKRMLGVRDITPSWCVMREWGLGPLQFNWFHAAIMRLYNSLTNSNSYTTEKVLHADMQLSSRSNDCWSSCILSAMDGLTQSCIYRQKLRNCEPIDPSHFVVDLREIHLEYWTTYSDTHLREHNSKRSTYHRLCAIPTKRTLVMHSPYILPKYMFFNLRCHVIRSLACFRLCIYTLRFETAIWNKSDSPTCDLCDADDIQDEQHVLIHCVIPHGDFSPQKTSLVKFSSFLLDLFPGTVLLAQVCCQVV